MTSMKNIEVRDTNKGGRKPEDLTDQVFGNLTVLEITPERKNNSVVWKCRC